MAEWQVELVEAWSVLVRDQASYELLSMVSALLELALVFAQFLEGLLAFSFTMVQHEI